MTLIPCPLHLLTGYDCPFCGAQRMFIALFKGDVVSAFWLNPVLFCLLPYFIILLIGALSKKAARWPVVRFCSSNRVLFSVLAIFLIWGIIRNLY